MAIEFVVENGTGKNNATAYITVAEYKQYWENRGETITGTDAQLQPLIISATEFLDSTYRFKGVTVKAGQSLEFPRYGVFKNDGRIVESDIVPIPIKNACAYLAKMKSDYELNTVSTNVRSESYGPVSKTYGGDFKQVFTLVNKLLWDYIVSGNRIIRVN